MVKLDEFIAAETEQSSGPCRSSNDWAVQKYFKPSLFPQNTQRIVWSLPTDDPFKNTKVDWRWNLSF